MWHNINYTPSFIKIEGFLREILYLSGAEQQRRPKTSLQHHLRSPSIGRMHPTFHNQQISQKSSTSPKQHTCIYHSHHPWPPKSSRLGSRMVTSGLFGSFFPQFHVGFWSPLFHSHGRSFFFESKGNRVFLEHCFDVVVEFFGY